MVDFKKIKGEVIAYEESLIEKRRMDVSPENLSHYVTLKDCYGREFSDAFRWLCKACDREDAKEVSELCEDYEQRAKEYASDWYDEDLNIVRGGYVFEAEVFKRLSDICKI